MLHVLGNVIHAILILCLPSVVGQGFVQADVVVDIFGDVAKQRKKTPDTFWDIQEAQSCKSYNIRIRQQELF